MALRVFISYATEDRSKARECYLQLESEGFDPWLDVRRLLPGQNWEWEIDKALRDAHVVVLLLSPRSVSKRGFVQREANYAIDQLKYKRDDDIYIVPILLEHCEVPTKISDRVQYVSLDDDGAWESVVASLRRAAEQQAVELHEGVAHGPFRVFTKTLSEEWLGMPGFNGRIEFPRFESHQQPVHAAELTAFFEGRAFASLVSARPKAWRDGADFGWSQSDDIAKDALLKDFAVASASDQLLSVWFSVSTYGAGAAHYNHGFDTYNFVLTPRVVPFVLEDLFADVDAAVRIISERCIATLIREYWERTGARPEDQSLDWLMSGAGPQIGNFESFIMDSKGLTFLFAPYEVGPYALGSWEVTVPFFDLIDHIEDGVRPMLPLRSNQQD